MTVGELFNLILDSDIPVDSRVVIEDSGWLNPAMFAGVVDDEREGKVFVIR